MNSVIPAPHVAPLERGLGNARPTWAEGLTDKQSAFVEHYAELRNATQAYGAAYDCRAANYDTRRVEGQRLLGNPKIQAAISARVKVGIDTSGHNVGMLLNRFMRIATADPRELIGLKVGACRRCYGHEHQYHWRLHEYLEEVAKAEQAARENVKGVVMPDPGGGLDYNATTPPNPDCPHCHGEGVERFVPRDTDNLSDDALLLYGGVKVKKDGYEIIIADQQKAAELAGRIMGAFTDKVKISGTIAAAVAVADMEKMDPQMAGKMYRDFVAGQLS